MDAIGRVNRLLLKLWQKLDLSCNYVKPGYLHLLIGDPPGLNKLRSLDRDIRGITNDMFHLPDHTTNQLLYCSKKDGGMAVPELTDLVIAAKLKGLASLCASGDPLAERLFRGRGEAMARKTARSMRLQWPSSIPEIIKWKDSRRKERSLEWAKQPTQGKGVECFRGNRVGNRWLTRTDLASGEEIDMLRIRSKTFPTKEYMARHGEVDTIFRGCRAAPEKSRENIGSMPCLEAWKNRKPRWTDVEKGFL